MLWLCGPASILAQVVIRLYLTEFWAELLGVRGSFRFDL